VLLQQLTRALGDLLHQLLQLRCGRCRHVTEYGWTITTWQIRTSFMKMMAARR